jgi:hypothetical protein
VLNHICVGICDATFSSIKHSLEKPFEENPTTCIDVEADPRQPQRPADPLLQPAGIITRRSEGQREYPQSHCKQCNHGSTTLDPFAAWTGGFVLRKQNHCIKNCLTVRQGTNPFISQIPGPVPSLCLPHPIMPPSHGRGWSHNSSDQD